MNTVIRKRGYNVKIRKEVKNKTKLAERKNIIIMYYYSSFNRVKIT